MNSHTNIKNKKLFKFLILMKFTEMLTLLSIMFLLIFVQTGKKLMYKNKNKFMIDAQNKENSCGKISVQRRYCVTQCTIQIQLKILN